MASKAADPISTVLTNITQKLRSGRRQCDIGKEVLRAALAKARVSEKEVQGLRNAIERLTAEKQQLLAAVSLSTAKQRPSNTTTTTTMSKEAREESKLKDQIVQGCQVFTRQELSKLDDQISRLEASLAAANAKGRSDAIKVIQAHGNSMEQRQNQRLATENEKHKREDNQCTIDREEKSRLEKQLEGIEETYAKKLANELEPLQEELEDLKERNAALFKSALDATNLKSTLEKKETELKKFIKERRVEKQELQEAQAKLHRENGQLKNKLETALKTKDEKLLEKLQTQKASNDSELADLQRKLDACRQEGKTADAQLATCTAELATRTAELATCTTNRP